MSSLPLLLSDKKPTTGKLLLCLILLLCWSGIEAKVKLPVFFSDNMVLQQKSQVAIWGQGIAGKTLRVITSWNKKNYLIKVKMDGSFMLKVATTAAGGPYTITFNDGTALVLKNILLGEVWVCSGQSNMEMPLEGWGKIQNYEEEIAKADYPQIRLLQVKKAASKVPLKDLQVNGGKGDSWQVCSPSTIADFSSVAYFFARALYRDKHIPIGLIHTSWGGTIAEAWTSKESLSTMPAFTAKLNAIKSNPGSPEITLKQFQAQMEVYQQGIKTQDSGYNGSEAVWAEKEFNTKAWKTMNLPDLWESSALPDFDGIVWFRKNITIPIEWAGKNLELSLGTIDDDDVTWFDGQQIGKTEGYSQKRVYVIPASLVKAGEAVISVRVTDNGGGGGFYGEPKQMSIGPVNGNKTPLAGYWAFKAAVSFANKPAPPIKPNDPNQVTVLYNAMIHPLIPYGIKGVIWYQGEANADRAYQYQTLFPLMIQDWRKNWGIGKFPFLYVQLANYMERADIPSESAWAELREAQLKTLKIENTGMAVIIDIGETKDIHPKNKQEVGRRLSLIARAKVYGEKVAWSGPVFQSLQIQGRNAVINFSHADSGLITKGAKALIGFALAGADQKFHWANAEIKGNTVILNCTEVQIPVAVRYGWADNPVCNLYNGAGLPASPFRTDSFTEITKEKK